MGDHVPGHDDVLKIDVLRYRIRSRAFGIHSQMTNDAYRNHPVDSAISEAREIVVLLEALQALRNGEEMELSVIPQIPEWLEEERRIRANELRRRVQPCKALENNPLRLTEIQDAESA